MAGGIRGSRAGELLIGLTSGRFEENCKPNLLKNGRSNRSENRGRPDRQQKAENDGFRRSTFRGGSDEDDCGTCSVNPWAFFVVRVFNECLTGSCKENTENPYSKCRIRTVQQHGDSEQSVRGRIVRPSLTSWPSPMII